MSRRRALQYAGFAGKNNLGDDVIREVYVDRLPGVSFYDVPRTRDELISGSVRHLIRTRRAPLLVGGGTLIGREWWREILNRTARVFRPRRWEMLGLGVEDPNFVGSERYTSASELAAWTPLLERFRNVTVRGPLSAATLAEYAGISAEVIGDPALLLRPASAHEGPFDWDVLVNTTAGEDQWGGRDFDWVPKLVAALRPIAANGAKIGFLSMEPTDVPWNTRVAEQLGIAHESVSPTTAGEFFSAVGRAQLVIGTRLHCNILAAAAGVPNLSLEYRPKCRDFMQSVGLDSSCYRITDFDPLAMAADATEAIATRAERSTSLLAAVDVLRGRLDRELACIAEGLAR